MKGRIAVLHEHGDFELQEFPVPVDAGWAVRVRPPHLAGRAARGVRGGRTPGGGWGADVVADLVGYPQVVPEGLQMLRSGGCYLEVGNLAPGNFFTYDATKIMRRNARIVGTSNYAPWAMPKALDFLRRNLGRFPVGKIISHTFPLERISEAFRQAEWLQRQGDPTLTRRAAGRSGSPGGSPRAR